MAERHPVQATHLAEQVALEQGRPAGLPTDGLGAADGDVDSLAFAVLDGVGRPALEVEHALHGPAGILTAQGGHVDGGHLELGTVVRQPLAQPLLALELIDFHL